MSIEEATREVLRRRTDQVTPPPLDVSALVRRGRRRRGLRTGVGAVAVLALVGGATGIGLWPDDPATQVADDGDVPVRTAGAQGPAPIRAPERVYRTKDKIFLDGTGFSSQGISFGTGAHLVPDGVAYPDTRTGVPHLLRTDGKRITLGPDRPAFGKRYGDWMAAAPDSGLASWVEIGDGEVELVAYDTTTMTEIGRRRVSCERSQRDPDFPEAGCPTPYVAADDVIFVHGAEGGTIAWRPADDLWQPLGDGLVNDARGHVVSLFEGSDDLDLNVLGPGWRQLSLTGKHWRKQRESGDAEALLSFDGRWVTDPNGLYVEDWQHPSRTITFRPPGEVVESQFDTDGSVLFVTTDESGMSRVWDCPVDARCVPLTEPSKAEVRLLATDT